ncbi:MAG: LCP family protein [Clostridia bacterium]|nr:LCP family protein [Clostridia bacterium]
MSKDRYDVYEDYDENRRQRQSSASNGKRGKKRKKRRSLKAKFFMVLSLVLFIYCAGALAYFGYRYYIEDGNSVPGNTRENAGLIEQFVKPKLKERTVFVILGVDKDGDRTDTIMVCCYNQPLDELTIISVPRDTLVEVSDEAFRMLNEEYPEPGQKGMKINEITHYGLEKYGLPLLFEELEEMIGVPIDYYCKVHFEALNYLVDSIGGVEFNVPMQMDYDDPTQDLSIHLKPGLQTLDGKQAEGLVRFRYGYNNQDIGRVATQQEFCKELIKQLVSKDAFFKNVSAYLTTFFKYVETDVKLSDAIKYMSVVKDFNTDNIVTYTMPGDIGSLYGFRGGYVINDEESQALCYDIFSKPVSEIQAERAAAAAQANGETADTPAFDDKTLDVQVLNGGYTNGKASAVQSNLLNNGYNVTSIGTYTGEKTNNTRIFVKSEGMGNTIKEMFPGSEVIVDSTIASNHDIVVVIGINEE